MDWTAKMDLFEQLRREHENKCAARAHSSPSARSLQLTGKKRPFICPMGAVVRRCREQRQTLMSSVASFYKHAPFFDSG